MDSCAMGWCRKGGRGRVWARAGMSAGLYAGSMGQGAESREGYWQGAWGREQGAGRGIGREQGIGSRGQGGCELAPRLVSQSPASRSALYYHMSHCAMLLRDALLNERLCTVLAGCLPTVLASWLADWLLTLMDRMTDG
eukprot:366492-Chlamydomonas_euryale.AAC.7